MCRSSLAEIPAVLAGSLNAGLRRLEAKSSQHVRGRPAWAAVLGRHESPRRGLRRSQRSAALTLRSGTPSGRVTGQNAVSCCAVGCAAKWRKALEFSWLRG